MKRYRQDCDWNCSGDLVESELGDLVRYDDLPKWVSVAERLPDESGHYLIRSGSWVDTEFFYWHEKGGFWGSTTVFPKHWMSLDWLVEMLPEPPK